MSAFKLLYYLLILNFTQAYCTKLLLLLLLLLLLFLLLFITVTFIFVEVCQLYFADLLTGHALDILLVRQRHEKILECVLNLEADCLQGQKQWGFALFYHFITVNGCLCAFGQYRTSY